MGDERCIQHVHGILCLNFIKMELARSVLGVGNPEGYSSKRVQGKGILLCSFTWDFSTLFRFQMSTRPQYITYRPRKYSWWRQVCHIRIVCHIRRQSILRPLAFVWCSSGFLTLSQIYMNHNDSLFCVVIFIAFIFCWGCFLGLSLWYPKFGDCLWQFVTLLRNCQLFDKSLPHSSDVKFNGFR